MLRPAEPRSGSRSLTSAPADAGGAVPAALPGADVTSDRAVGGRAMNDLAGTGTLVRLALRRDRILLPVWIVVFVISAASSATATVDLYPTRGPAEAAGRQRLAGARRAVRPDLRPVLAR